MKVGSELLKQMASTERGVVFTDEGTDPSAKRKVLDDLRLDFKVPLPRALRTPCPLHALHRSIGQTLQDSFSAVSKPNLATKDALESS